MCPQRRHFMGEVVNAIGDGGQRWAESILGWSRTTIRKAQQELANSSTQIEDKVHSRCRKPIEITSQRFVMTFAKLPTGTVVRIRHLIQLRCIAD